MTPPSSRDDFAALYSRCHLDLLRYVLTLLPDRHRAEDVVQETARMLWRKFDEYDAARPFWPWARQFAHFEVLKARRRIAVHERCFSDELIERLAEERAAADDISQGSAEVERQREALASCVDRLDPLARAAPSRYSREQTVQTARGSARQIAECTLSPRSPPPAAPRWNV